jgi:outer membrane protein assembly factor BamD (BamD/ComL family)
MTSISALSSNLINDLSRQQRQNPFQEIKQDFNQLASALQSGDLSGAQSAYSNIQQLFQANPGASPSNATSNGSNTVQSDFAALGQALQSGDLSQAQSAFSQLQSDVRGGTAQAPAVQANDQYVSSLPQSSSLPQGSSAAQAAAGQNPIEEALQDYSQLATSLQAGDLTTAQSAYNNLQQLIQAGQGPSSSSSAFQTDFATLGQDLQTGNLAQAQSEFSQLQSDSQAQTQNPVQQVQQDYSELASALQTGDLTGAQSAFVALQQALQSQTGQSSAATSNSTNSNDPIANDLNALGQALSSGNLTQAQSAFSTLQTDIQAAQQSGAGTSQTQKFTRVQKGEERHHHHHGGGGGSSSQSSSSTTSAANSYTSSSTSSTVSVFA